MHVRLLHHLHELSRVDVRVAPGGDVVEYLGGHARQARVVGAVVRGVRLGGVLQGVELGGEALELGGQGAGGLRGGRCVGQEEGRVEGVDCFFEGLWAWGVSGWFGGEGGGFGGGRGVPSVRVMASDDIWEGGVGGFWGLGGVGKGVGVLGEEDGGRWGVCVVSLRLFQVYGLSLDCLLWQVRMACEVPLRLRNPKAFCFYKRNGTAVHLPRCWFEATALPDLEQSIEKVAGSVKMMDLKCDLSD